MTSALEPVYLTAHKNAIFPNIVCIHGYGSEPESTWHHKDTGKTWNKDDDFMDLLDGSCRVFNYWFNGAISANLSAAGILFHAHDLLVWLSSAIVKGGSIGPVFFVAHSWGGIILKKAVHLVWTHPSFRHIKDSLAGLWAHRMSIMIWESSLTQEEDDEIPESDIRLYALAVRQINEIFSKCRPDGVFVSSFWETEPTSVGTDTGCLIISEDCRLADVDEGLDATMECSHADLGRFSSPADLRFRKFILTLNQLVMKIMTKEDLPVFSWPQERAPAWLQERPPEPSPSRPPSPPPTPPNGTPKDPSSRPKPLFEPKDGTDERIVYWKKRTQAEENHKQRADFLRSLKGWSEYNTGSHIAVAPGTGSWIMSDPAFSFWRTDPDCGTMFVMGDAGTGKTYLAKDISNRLQVLHPTDTTMFFQCIPGERPAVWEFFTWHLISHDPTWFDEVPAQYRTRDTDSPPLSRAAFTEIWNAFRARCFLQSIYMVVDGLEQCGGDVFEETLKTVQQLRLPTPLAHSQARLRGNKRPAPTRVKLAFTCRPTPASDLARMRLTYTMIRPQHISESIAAYIRSRWPPSANGKEDKFDQKEIETCIKEVTAYAKSYWTYARYALEHVQQAVLHDTPIQLNVGDEMPAGLKTLLHRQISDKLRQPGLDQVTRNIVTFLAAAPVTTFFPVPMLEDVVRVLGPEERDGYNLTAALTRDWGDFINISADDNPTIGFLHETIAYVMRSIIPEKQRHLNNAFVCINYLLLKDFASPAARLSSGHFHGLFIGRFFERYHFYQSAASLFLRTLRSAGDLGLQLEPFLRAFFDRQCPQYRTWCAFLQWKRGNWRGTPSSEDPVVLKFVQAGCVHILKHLLPPPRRHRTTPSKGLLSLARISRKEEVEDSFLEVKDWPETANAEGETALMIAIQSGKADIVNLVLDYDPNVNARSRAVEKLLRCGASINACDNSGLTPLCYAAELGDVEAARLLLSYGANIHISGCQGDSPLEKSLFSRNNATFDELVAQGADVDTPLSLGENPLSICIEGDRLDMFQTLLPVCDVNAKDANGWRSLNVACDARERNEYIRLLLEHPAIDVNVLEDIPGCRVAEYPLNALTRAVCNENYEAVEMLLHAGANPGRLPGMETSPVFMAVVSKNIDMVRLLLSFNSPVNVYVPTPWPCTALGVAVQDGNEEMVELLLSHGADPTIEDAFGRLGPLAAATMNVKNPNMRIIRMLLSARIPADVNVSCDGTPTIGNAVKSNNPELVRMFLDSAADLTAWLEPAETSSPLVMAAREGYVEICEMLVESEPRLLHVQFRELINCNTPLLVAARDGHTDTVRFLLSKGARADLLSPVYRESPLVVACSEGHLECVELLLEAAPEMVHVPDAWDCMPLIEACEAGHLKIIKALCEAGADFRRKDRCGNSFASQDFFSDNPRSERTIELLIEYGLDINAPIDAEGLTILGWAVLKGKARHVKWLLEHGADPLRCQKPLIGEEPWRNALVLSMEAKDEDVLELLLEPQRGLWEHLGDLDELGSSVLSFGDDSVTKARKARIVQALERHQMEKGEDVIGVLLSTPDIYGRTPVDLALGRVEIHPTARTTVKERIMQAVEKVLGKPEYNHNNDQELTLSIACDLLLLGGHDTAATALLSFVVTIPRVSRTKEGRYEELMAWRSCAVCDESITKVALACRFCWRLKCTECVDGTERRPPHECDTVEVPLVKNEAFCLRNALQTILAELQSSDEHVSSQDETEATRDPEILHLQSTLQLATLHAFNLLAFRRPLFTPYLDLAPSVRELIAPWEDMIAKERRYWESDNFKFEKHWARRLEEIKYLNRGLGRAYVDEEDVRRGKTLEDVGGLFEVQEDVSDRRSVTEVFD